MCKNHRFRIGKNRQCQECNNLYHKDYRSKEETNALVKKSLRQKQKSAASHLILDPDEFDTGILDIEATGLAGDFDLILCVCIKKLDRELKMFSVDISQPDLMVEEKRMLLEVKDYLDTLDCIITYYGTGFDMPMLRSRMILHNIPPPDKIKHLDMYYTIRRSVNPHSRRMDSINEMIRFSDENFSPQKTRINPLMWNKALYSRDRKAMDYILEHCKIDVEILGNIVQRFKQYLPEKIVRG